MRDLSPSESIPVGILDEVVSYVEQTLLVLAESIQLAPADSRLQVQIRETSRKIAAVVIDDVAPYLTDGRQP